MIGVVDSDVMARKLLIMFSKSVTEDMVPGYVATTQSQSLLLNDCASKVAWEKRSRALAWSETIFKLTNFSTI